MKVLEVLVLEYNIIKTMKELQMSENEQTSWYQGTDEETIALIVWQFYYLRLVSIYLL
jgi:hypothetical protein